MEVQDVLVEALRAVDEAGIEGELRQVAFAKAVDLLAMRSTPAQATQSAETRSEPTPVVPAVLDHPLDRVAGRLKLDGETVRQVYDVNGDEFSIIVGAGKLEKRASTGTKEIAMLVAAGRQAAGIEDWTPVDEIRRWAEEYKRLDSSNFAGTLKEMDSDFSFRGSGRKREVRLSRPGWDRAAELVNRLGNGAQS